MDSVISSMVEVCSTCAPLKYIPTQGELSLMTEQDAVATLVKCFHQWKVQQQQRQIQEIMKKNKGRLDLAAYLKNPNPPQPQKATPQKEDDTGSREIFVQRLERYFARGGFDRASFNLSDKAALCLYSVITSASDGSILDKLVDSQGFGLFQKLWEFQKPIKCGYNGSTVAHPTCAECSS